MIVMGRVIVLGLCMITRDIDVTSLEFGSFDVDTDLGLGVFVSEEHRTKHTSATYSYVKSTPEWD